MIGGNIVARVQTKTTTRNPIGEAVETWSDVGQVFGWLDFIAGQNDVSQYKAKLQDTTHVFICDHFRWKTIQGVTAENSRMVVNGKVYNILLIDNPMELNQQVEVNLQFIGGGLGV